MRGPHFASWLEFVPQPGRLSDAGAANFSKKAAQRSDWPIRLCWCCSASLSRLRWLAIVRRFASWLGDDGAPR